MADKAQVEGSREEPDPTDFYAPVATRFRLDPRRTGDATLNSLLALARPDDVWIDVGAGGGRYALPLALHVREVVAIDPSPAMLGVLREDAEGEGIANIRVIDARWPLHQITVTPQADVALMAHVGYDIAEIGPFIDALETSARRLCVAVMGESAMATVATLFWNDIHGEPRVRLPALQEMVSVLFARGRLPQVTLVDREAHTFASFDKAMAMARRQLWLRAGSPKDQRLVGLARGRVTERDGRFAFDEMPAQIGVISWSPHRMGGALVRP
jgi:Methyltransferase domain